MCKWKWDGVNAVCMCVALVAFLGKGELRGPASALIPLCVRYKQQGVGGARVRAMAEAACARETAVAPIVSIPARAYQPRLSQSLHPSCELKSN